MRPNLENVLPRMAGSFSGNLRVDAVWLYQCEAGQNAESPEDFSFYAKGKGRGKNIKDKPKGGGGGFSDSRNSRELGGRLGTGTDSLPWFGTRLSTRRPSRKPFRFKTRISLDVETCGTLRFVQLQNRLQYPPGATLSIAQVVQFEIFVR